MSDREPMLYFGEFTEAEMDEARRCAVEAMKKYGDLVGEEYERFLGNPWNDHCSVQAAMRALHSPLRILPPGESDEATVERAQKLWRALYLARYEDGPKIVEQHMRAALAAIGSGAPIDAVLFCPACGLQHVDAPDGEWTNPAHKTHQCHRCGHLWRPAAVPTNGVADVPLGTTDTRPAIRAQGIGSGAGRDAVIERLRNPDEAFVVAVAKRTQPNLTGGYLGAVIRAVHKTMQCTAAVLDDDRALTSSEKTDSTPPDLDYEAAAAARNDEPTLPAQTGADIDRICEIEVKPFAPLMESPLAASDLRERAHSILAPYRNTHNFAHEPIKADYEVLVEKITWALAAIRAEAKAEGWENARQECRQVAFDYHMDVSSDFDEGYDSAVADIVDNIEALSANRLTEQTKAEPTWDDAVALVRRSNEIVRYSQSGESLADWLAANRPTEREG